MHTPGRRERPARAGGGRPEAGPALPQRGPALPQRRRTRHPWRRGEAAAPAQGGSFSPTRPADGQQQAHQPCHGDRVPQHHPVDRRTDGADPHPHRVRGAQRNLRDGIRQTRHAGRERDQEEHRGPQPVEGVRRLQSSRPQRLQAPGDDQHAPRQAPPVLLRSARPDGTEDPASGPGLPSGAAGAPAVVRPVVRPRRPRPASASAATSASRGRSRAPSRPRRSVPSRGRWSRSRWVRRRRWGTTGVSRGCPRPPAAPRPRDSG